MTFDLSEGHHHVKLAPAVLLTKFGIPRALFNVFDPRGPRGPRTPYPCKTLVATPLYMLLTKFGQNPIIKGVLHLWALFLKTLCIFSKNKATSDKVSYGSGQKCSKELENYSITSVETIVVKLQWKMCENQYFPCFEP